MALPATCPNCGRTFEFDFVTCPTFLCPQCVANGRIVDSLVQELHDSRTRAEAAKKLGRLGDARAVEPLIRQLYTKDPAIAAALGRLGVPAVAEPLARQLSSCSDVDRSWSMYADSDREHNMLRKMESRSEEENVLWAKALCRALRKLPRGASEHALYQEVLMSSDSTQFGKKMAERVYDQFERAERRRKRINRKGR